MTGFMNPFSLDPHSFYLFNCMREDDEIFFSIVCGKLSLMRLGSLIIPACRRHFHQHVSYCRVLLLAALNLDSVHSHGATPLGCTTPWAVRSP